MSYEHVNALQRILLIEDNAEMAENIASILELANYDVVRARNGKLGVSEAQKQPPDLILCDIMMPELDGYGVLHILHQDPSTANIPFVFLSARADKSEVREGMNLGADDYITKPFDTTDLLKVIEVRLKKNDSTKGQPGGNDFKINSLFSDAKEHKELEKLTSDRPARTFRKKEFIYVEGQTPTELFFVRRGEIKTYKVNYDGKELITGIHDKGSFLGYEPLLEEHPYHENAEVMDEAEIVMIPRQDFLQMVYSSKDIARKFIRLISQKLGEAEDRLLDLAYQSVRQRVAGVLLKLHHQLTAVQQTTVITICRKDISSIVGTATESLNRTLADFKDEGLVEIRDDGIRLLNPAKLERLLR
jgi:CRP-like cAMP-binding protein/CheY-like chemotaxis protein